MGTQHTYPLEVPENVATLMRVIATNLVSDHTFPSAPPKYVASLASSLIKDSGAERNASKEVLNCLRVLQRVLPVVFELESEPSVFEREVLWKRDVVVDEDEDGDGDGDGAEAGRDLREQAPQFVIEDDDEESGGESAAASESAASPSRSPQIPTRQATTPSADVRKCRCTDVKGLGEESHASASLCLPTDSNLMV